MKIEYKTDAYFHSDGTRRVKPKASTMHGWLAKMRGTLLGDEALRSRGIREMKEAKALKKWYKENPRSKPSTKRRPSQKQSGSSFYFFGGKSSQSKSRPAPSRQNSHVVRHRSSSHRLVGRTSQKSTQGRPRASRQGSSNRSGASSTRTSTRRSKPSTRR
ncbi:hypothetical protein VKT23_001867 [Stygiomarasmius scandens]|uniref:Uncharacterized protein n=1 Tax=Marasmiellus scandens TaxID=2682957 RepID=A0ABR1K082_9AGAR